MVGVVARFLELLARILSTWLLFGLVLSEVVGMKAMAHRWKVDAR